MAYFGRKPEKPGSVPGAASGGAEERTEARARNVIRKVTGGRTERAGKSGRNTRSMRAGRSAR